MKKKIFEPELTERFFEELLRLENKKEIAEIALFVGESVQTVTNWVTRGVSNEGLIKAAVKTDLDIHYVKTGERRAIKHAIGKNHVKNTTLKEIIAPDPLQNSANKHAEVFMSLSNNNRELLQMLANRMMEHDHPNDTRLTGKRTKNKEKEIQ